MVVQTFFPQINNVHLGIPVCFDIESVTPTTSHGVQYSLLITLAAVSFKVVILLFFVHCLLLLPFGVFVLVSCFVVWFLVWII